MRVKVIGPPGSAQLGMVGEVVNTESAADAYPHIARAERDQSAPAPPKTRQKAHRTLNGPHGLPADTVIAEVSLADGRTRAFRMGDLEVIS